MNKSSPIFGLCFALGGALPLLGCSDAASDFGAGGASPGVAGSGVAGNAAGGGPSPMGGTGGTNSQPGAAGAAGVGGSAAGGSSAGAPAQVGGASGAGGGSAGAGGSNSGGTSGTTGGSGGSSGGKVDVKKSAGCGTSTTQMLGQFVDSMVMSGGANRPYAVRLPSPYDPARAYPVIVLLHGCGSGTNNVSMEKSTGADAILIRGTGSAADTCWDTKADGPDVKFFDAMVADAKARFCTDEHRFFAVGYSSGSWLANQLTCVRADVLRGAATVTGGESASGQCGGPVARIFIHDQDDTTNVISGSEKARDRQLTQNMCNKTAQPMAVSPSPCQLYQGCATGYPVEFCKTSGQKHNRQDSLAAPAFWDFFKAL